MNMKLVSFLFVLFLLNKTGAAQKDNNSFKIDRSSFGLGLGLDYGSVGGNFITYPQRNIGVFVGVGYAIVNVGINAGVKLRYISKNKPSKFNPFFLLMYGLNTAVYVSNATEYNKSFYGKTFGLGLDFSLDKRKNGYWSFAFMIPNRSSESKSYIRSLKNNKNFSFDKDQSQFGLSLGYRFIVQ